MEREDKVTQEQFDSIKWTGGMKAKYKDKNYDIGSVCFEEKLIGITGYCTGADENDLQWVRCENIEIA